MIRALALLAAACCAVAWAEDHGHDHDVTPAAERAAPTAGSFGGPAKNEGVSVEPVAAIDLAAEFPELKGHRLRARVITIAAGGQVAVHEHQKRPGLAYILEGEVVEHRADAEEPVVRGPGKHSVEGTGVVHWWENVSDRPMRALVVDIVPE